MENNLSKAYRLLPYLLLTAIAILFALFSERIPVNGGLGWDGMAYGNLTINFSFEFLVDRHINPYYFIRILPSVLVHYVLSALNLPLVDKNIILGFSILNILCLNLILYYWLNISRVFKFSAQIKLLGVIFLFLNYAISKFSFYYPVLTDTFTFTLGIAVWNYFLTSRQYALLICLIIGYFTFPTLFIAGAILYLIEYRTDKAPSPVNKNLKNSNMFLIAALAFGIIYYLIFTLIPNLLGRAPSEVNPINKDTLYISFLCIVVYLSVVTVFFFRYFPSRIKDIPARINPFHAVTALALLYNLKLLVGLLSAKVRPALSFMDFLTNVYQQSITNPLLFIVAHTIYYGPAIMLMIYFFKKMVIKASEIGLGCFLFVFAYLALGVGSESRQFINAYPVFVTLLCLVLSSYRISNIFVGAMGMTALLFSKIWYPINQEPFSGSLLEFPWQRYFFSQGPWMSNQMYYLQGSVVLIAFIMIYILFRKNLVLKHD